MQKKADPAREPLPPPFPVGTRLRCIEGHDAYVPRVDHPRDIRAHFEDWPRVSGRGIEVTIDLVKPGSRGTGQQLCDAGGPMSDDAGEPILDETQDGRSIYQVVRGRGPTARMSGWCIDPSSAHKWQVATEPLMVRPGDFLKEGIDLGLVLTSGERTYDVIWIGGSTTRYQHGKRHVQIVPAAMLDTHSREHLVHEAEAARRERRAGAQIRRGTVSPRR